MRLFGDLSNLRTGCLCGVVCVCEILLVLKQIFPVYEQYEHNLLKRRHAIDFQVAVYVSTRYF